MTLAPLLTAAPVIVSHAAAAFAALALGAVQFVLRKGTFVHKSLGWIWVGLMALVSISSFGIHTIRQFGPFSWIHGLSVFALIMLVLAIVHARAGRIEAHRWTMIGLFVGAVVITGLFTLMPGRIMHDVLIGPSHAPGKVSLTRDPLRLGVSDLASIESSRAIGCMSPVQGRACLAMPEAGAQRAPRQAFVKYRHDREQIDTAMQQNTSFQT